MIRAATAAVLIVALSSCTQQRQAATNIAKASAATALGSGERVLPGDLQKQANAERRRRTAQPMDVPPPPGVEPELLAERQSGRALAEIDLREALRFLVDGEEAGDDRALGGARIGDDAAKPREAKEQAIDAATRDEALKEYARGRDAALQRRHLSAVTHYLKALELVPDDTATMRELARSYLGLGNFSKAIQTYRDILAIDPHHSEAAFMAALSAADQRDFETAAHILARKKVDDGGFAHDEGANVLADYVLSMALAQLGYDRASIEAAEAALQGVETPNMNSMYSARLGSVYRQRGEIRRAIGDAYCRLGEYDNALIAYDRSAELPSPDPMALAPRVLYANLRLGRMHSAQLELYAALATDVPNVSERLVRLCEYVQQQSTDLNALQRAVLTLQSQHPSNATLARAAAALLPEDRALALMRRFVIDHPQSVQMIGEILGGLAERDLQEAVEFAAAVVDEQPELADETIKRLFMAVGRPSDAVRAARQLEGAAPAVVEARLLLHMGALGPAWSAAQQACERDPTSVAVLYTRMEIAANLEEPVLLQQVIDAWDGPVSGGTLLEQARALRRAGDPQAALHKAEQARVRGADEVEALVEAAWAHLALSARQSDTNVAQVHGQDAVQYAEQAIELAPADDRPFRVLTTVYGPGGALDDAAKLRESARRLFDANPDSRLYAQLVVEESLARRRYEQALESALNLYETDPWDSASLRMAVAAWRQMNRMEDAVRWLDQKLEERPGDPHLLEQWTSVQLAMNRTDRALQRLQSHVEQDPLDYAARHLLESAYRAANRMSRAVELGEQRLSERPFGIRRELELAALHAQVNEFDEVLAHLDTVLEHVDDATRRQLIAAVNLAQRIDDAEPGRTATLLALVDETTQRFDDLPLELYAPALVTLAERGASAGEFESMAARAVADVARSDGGGVQAALAWQRVAQQLVDVHRPAFAGLLLEQRVLTRPFLTDDRAHTALCMMTFTANAAAGGRAGESLALLSALKADSRLPAWPGADRPAAFPEAMYELSQMYFIIGDVDGAMSILEELVRLDPDNAMAMNNLGYFRIETGDDSERVAQLIEHAYALRPNESNVIDSMGWLRYKQGRFGGPGGADDNAAEDKATGAAGPEHPADEQGGADPEAAADNAAAERGALEYLTRAVQVSDEPSAESLDHLGDAQWRLGRAREAVATWNRVVVMLENELWQRQMVSVYEFMMERQWLLVVGDPQEMYDREFGVILEQARAKLEAAKKNVPPPVAPTFAELRPVGQ